MVLTSFWHCYHGLKSCCVIVPEDWHTLITSYSLVLTSFWRHCRELGNGHLVSSVINLYISFGFNKKSKLFGSSEFQSFMNSIIEGM